VTAWAGRDRQIGIEIEACLEVGEVEPMRLEVGEALRLVPDDPYATYL